MTIHEHSSFRLAFSTMSVKGLLGAYEAARRARAMWNDEECCPRAEEDEGLAAICYRECQGLDAIAAEAVAELRRRRPADRFDADLIARAIIDHQLLVGELDDIADVAAKLRVAAAA